MASDEKIARAMTLMRRWCSWSALRNGRPSRSRLRTAYMSLPRGVVAGWCWPERSGGGGWGPEPGGGRLGRAAGAAVGDGPEAPPAGGAGQAPVPAGLQPGQLGPGQGRADPEHLEFGLGPEDGGVAPGRRNEPEARPASGAD